MRSETHTRYLNVLKSGDLSTEQAQYSIEVALKQAIYAKEIVDSVYQYMNEKRKGQWTFLNFRRMT